MRRLTDYFLKSSGEKDNLNLELELLNLTKYYSTKMCYNTMRKKSQKYIRKIQKLTPVRPEKRMLNLFVTNSCHEFK